MFEFYDKDYFIMRSNSTILIKDSTILFLFFILVRLQFYIYAQICPAGLLIHIFDSLIKKKKVPAREIQGSGECAVVQFSLSYDLIDFFLNNTQLQAAGRSVRHGRCTLINNLWRMKIEIVLLKITVCVNNVTGSHSRKRADGFGTDEVMTN